MLKKPKLTGRPFIYPWERWLIRKTPITLKPGLDPKANEFTAKPHGMIVMIRENATRLGVKVSVYPQPDGSIKIVPRGKRV